MLHERSSRSSLVALLSVLAFSTSARAQPAANDLLLHPRPSAIRPPSLERPEMLGSRAVKLAEPFWTPEGVWIARPAGLFGLAKAEHAGAPVYDPSTDAWYATAVGCLVRVEPDGSLPVLFDNVQGHDIDVRAAKGLAVSREPDDTIVLYRWSGAQRERKVLLRGYQFFNPRFSPDGSGIVVSESRAGGGHVWLVALDGKATDLGKGISPAWHPDGRRLVFLTLETDGHTIAASTIWQLDLTTKSRTSLGRTTSPVAVNPSISPDGRWIAFAGQGTNELFLAAFPGSDAQGRK